MKGLYPARIWATVAVADRSLTAIDKLSNQATRNNQADNVLTRLIIREQASRWYWTISKLRPVETRPEFNPVLFVQ